VFVLSWLIGSDDDGCRSCDTDHTAEKNRSERLTDSGGQQLEIRCSTTSHASEQHFASLHFTHYSVVACRMPHSPKLFLIIVPICEV